MLFAKVLLGFMVLSQTKIDQATQTKNTNISPNGYVFIVNDITGKVQLFPGPYFGKAVQIENYPVPPSGAICGRNIDGAAHPVYEFGRPGSVVFSDDYMYICTPAKKWKRILMENF